ncbi:MAG: dTDP-4-dehydrorhamnose 3,5-epimerase [Candidatus Kapabacteria bacterium]|nr:dTDP-4-dehydrorhamnose 3,5-epimerase [Candidatus Kapabacteria bacterium]
MKIKETFFDGEVKLLEPTIFPDSRGFFMEAYREDTLANLGLPSVYRQDNLSGSVKNVIRGLHFQWSPAMSKLMRVNVGTAFLVAVDIRIGSPTFGKWVGVEASADNKLQLFAPAYFARGFCILSEYAEIYYKCTAIYNQPCESGILFSDPDIGIDWPVKNPILSDKDAKAQTLQEWVNKPESKNFLY